MASSSAHLSEHLCMFLGSELFLYRYMNTRMTTTTSNSGDGIF